MENWQLTLIILSSVFMGALIPVLIMAAIALFKVIRQIVEIGPSVKRTLAHIETISDRVEILSNNLDRNMKIINILSLVASSIGPVVSAISKKMHTGEGQEEPVNPDDSISERPAS